MATAADRLKQVSGLAGISAASMLLSVGAGATAGAALVNYSGLAAASAATHLLTDRAQPPASGGGYGFLPEKKPRRDTDDDLLMCFLL